MANAEADRVARVEVRNFRTAREVAFAPGPMCALVGESGAGKSNLLAAIRAALDPAGALGATDPPKGGEGPVAIRIELAGGAEVTLRGTPERHERLGGARTPPLVFLPADARASTLVAESDSAEPETVRVLEIFRRAHAARDGSSAAPSLAALDAVEACCGANVRGVVLLIEEPELYLRPQFERYFYRQLRRFAEAGNQVVYSTHSPSFLNVARLDEIVFVERLPEMGTRTAQPPAVTPETDFRVLTEFDAARSELFLARTVVLVEGETERLALPFVFAALGEDPDREAISIVECGGKPNIPLFARICRAVGVPFLVVHDSDETPGRKTVAAERALNALIAEVAGDAPRIVLEPDFEAVAGLRGRKEKPKRAWHWFSELSAEQMPPELVGVVEQALELASVSRRR